MTEQTSQNPSQLKSACEGGGRAVHWGPIPGPVPALEGPEKRCEPVWGLFMVGNGVPGQRVCLHPESKDQNPAAVALCSQAGAIHTDTLRWKVPVSDRRKLLPHHHPL